MAKEVGLRGRMDITQFNANVQSFIRSISGMNKEVARVAKESAAGATEAGKAVTRFGVNWQRVKDIVTGIVVIDVFRQISRGIRSMVADALDATAVFQSMLIMLEAILARDIAKEFGISVADALKKAGEEAQVLLGWVRKVAVTTPFSVESIAQALAYGQAFGFNVAQSKRLTLATGDFVAGMGLTDEHMRRIIYNFGQMLASGRVLGRELRDLANNFVPIRDITQRLADEAGIPFEEMKKGMKEARVSAQQFIGAFVALAEEDFEGAMERMARTIRGVQQNISDFIRTLFGLELLGPVMERIAHVAADALDAAFSPETIRGFTLMGQILLASFEKIFLQVKLLIINVKDLFAALGFGAPTLLNLASTVLYAAYAIAEFLRALRKGVKAITEFVNTLSGKFNTTFAQIVQNAGKWGISIISALADGMAQAVSIIIDVLRWIASIFTYWLRGSSPPKLLPDLTKWGKQAMESWLEGWTSADFGLFNDITNIVTSFVRSLKGKIPETDIIPRILGARSAIKRAIQDMREFGTITEGSLKRILGAVKEASGPLRKFIKESFKFAKISAIVEAVKKVLDFDITLNVPTKILGQTISSLGDLIDLAKTFKGEIGNALRSYVDSLGKVARADERVARAQRFLNDMLERYSTMLRILRQQQDALREEQDVTGRVSDIEAAIASGLLTDEEKRRLEMEKEEILIQHKINALENERDVVVDIARKRLAAEEAVAESVERHLEYQRKLVEQLADEQLSAARERLEAARSLVQLQIDQNNLMGEQVALLERLAKAAGGEDIPIPGLDFEGFTEAFEDSLLASKEEIAKAIEDLRKDVNKRIRDFIDSLLAPFAGIKEKLSALLTDIAGVFAVAVENEGMKNLVASIKIFVGNMIEVFGNLKTFWEENGPGILVIIEDFFTRLAELLPVEDILTSIGLSLEAFGGFLTDLSTKLVESGPQIQESLQGWVDWVFDEGIPKLIEFGEMIRDDIIPVLERFVNFMVANAPTILPILAALATGFLSLRPVLTILGALGAASLKILPLLLVLQSLSGVGATLGATLGGIAGGIGTALTAIGGFIATNFLPIVGIVLVVIGIFQALKDDVFGLKTALVTAFDSMKEAIEPAIGPLKEAFAELLPSLQKLFKSLAPVGRLLMQILKGIGVIILSVLVPVIILLIGFFTGLIRGAIRGFTALLRSIGKIADGISEFVDGIFEVIGGLGDIIVGIFNWDVDKIKAGIERVKDGLLDAFDGLVLIVQGAFELLIGNVLEFLKGFGEGVIDFFANFFDSMGISDKFIEISETVRETFDRLKENLRTAVENMVSTISEFFTNAFESGKEFVQNIIDGVRENIFGESGLIAKVRHYIELVILRAKLLYYKYKVLGKEFVDNIIEGIRNKVEGALGLYEQFKTFLSNTVEKAKELYDDLVQAGKDFIQGLIDGIIAKALDLYDTVKNVIKTALGIAQKESKSKSPSEAMRNLGQSWMTGLQLGFLDEATSTKETLVGIFEDLMSVPGSLSGGLGLEDMFNVSGGNNRMLTQPSPSTSNVQNLNVEVNAAYSQVQSESSIYYDVQAALAHISR